MAKQVAPSNKLFTNAESASFSITKRVLIHVIRVFLPTANLAATLGTDSHDNGVVYSQLRCIAFFGMVANYCK